MALKMIQTGDGQQAPLIQTPVNQYVAKRRPVEHSCKCGHKEMIVPPCCSEGVMVWTCKCGTKYRMIFQGEGRACGESIYKGVF